MTDLPCKDPAFRNGARRRWGRTGPHRDWPPLSARRMVFGCQPSRGTLVVHERRHGLRGRPRSSLLGLLRPAQPDGTSPHGVSRRLVVRTCELMDSPAAAHFLDWWIEQPAFKSYFDGSPPTTTTGRAWNRGVAINYKNDAFTPRAAVLDLERGQLAGFARCSADGHSRGQEFVGYIKGLEYKSPESIVGDWWTSSARTARCCSHRARADGTIPQETRHPDRGRQMLEVNGEAITGRALEGVWEGPTRLRGHVHRHQAGSFTSQDIRFTTRGRKRFTRSVCSGRKD